MRSFMNILKPWKVCVRGIMDTCYKTTMPPLGYVYVIHMFVIVG